MSVLVFFAAFYGTLLIRFHQADELSGNAVIGIMLESLAAGVAMIVVWALIDLCAGDDDANDR